MYYKNNKINLLKYNCLNFKLFYSNYPISTFFAHFFSITKDNHFFSYQIITIHALICTGTSHKLLEKNEDVYL